MQVKELKQDGLSYEYEVTIPANDIDTRVDAKLQEVGKTIRIQGFRPGKVPMNILKQRYGKAILGEILEEAVNQTSQDVLKDKSLRPAMQPKIEVKSFDENQDLVYSMNFEVLPEIKLADFKGIKLEKAIAEISEETLNESLETIASSNVSTQKIETDRATKDGDTVMIDFDGRTADDDVHHEGMKAEGHMLKLGAGQFIEGFEPQLVGKKAGDKVEVKVAFPEQYGAAHLAGRDAIFDVTIHEIHEEIAGKADDELAKRLGMADLDALKNAVKEQLQKEYDSQSRMLLKKELLDILDEKHQFELPEMMREAEYNNIVDQVKADRQQRGDSDVELSEEEQAEYKDIAARRVRLGLVLSEIGHQNNITVSDPELQKAVITEAQRYPGQEKEVFDFYSKNRQALESLRGPIFEEKTVDFILELAEVKEKSVSAEELASALNDGEEEHHCHDESCSHESHKKPAKKKGAAKKTTASKKEDTADKPKKAAPKKKAAAKK